MANHVRSIFLASVALLLLAFAFVAMSAPEKDSIASDCSVHGTFNDWRMRLQGQRFWALQADHLRRRIADYEKYPERVARNQEERLRLKATVAASTAEAHLTTIQNLRQVYASEKFHGYGGYLLAADAMKEKADQLAAESEELRQVALENIAAINAKEAAEALTACLANVERLSSQ